jgi:hypothetical protein
MENFFSWMTKIVPKDEVIVWFNVHNMIYEKIELYGDIFRTLNQIVIDTYLGNDTSETKIIMSDEDKKNHFEWCWKKTITLFSKENIKIKNSGDHKNYMEDFFMDTFYNQGENILKKNISYFIDDVFNIEKDFTKSDLDVLTELYKLLNKNVD